MQQEMTLREISRAAGIPEKEVIGHLEHIRNSVKADNMKLIVHPCACISCGFVFKDRRRFSRPGRCPKCRGERIDGAIFFIR